MTEGDYQGAIDTFEKLGDYKDSQEYIELLQTYTAAKLLFEEGSFEESAELFTNLEEFLDSKDFAEKARNKAKNEAEVVRLYNEAKKYYQSKDYEKALVRLKKLGNHLDSQLIAQECEIALCRLHLSSTISAGVRYSVGVTQYGDADLIGDFRGTGAIDSWKNLVSISGMSKYVVGLKEDGTVVFDSGSTQDDYNCHIDTSDWTNIIEVSAGEQYIVGLKADGTLKAQGIDGYKETDIDNWKNIIAISTAWQLTVGLDSAGEVHITGRNSEKLLDEISKNEDWTDIIAVAAGGGKNNVYGEAGHVVALKSDGTVVAVGDNRKGQCNVTGKEWRDIVAISAGAYHTVGLRSDGSVVTTLDPKKYEKSNRIITNWDNIIAISAGYGFTLGLTKDGTVLGAGNENEGQIPTESSELWEGIMIHKMH